MGRVGRSLEAATDLQMPSEILSYSRSRGVFAGLTLGGSTLRADQSSAAGSLWHHYGFASHK